MLNRRHLRIRVLQALYAWKKTPERDLAKAEKIFMKSLQEVEELYIFLLLYLIEIKDYALVVDVEDPSKLRFYNLEGESYANSFHEIYEIYALSSSHYLEISINN